MWKYQEQQSFGYTPQEYEQRLNYVAAALVAWGSVTAVQVRGLCMQRQRQQHAALTLRVRALPRRLPALQTQLAATKDRPRVGKAVSIMLDVPEEQAREWIAW